MSKYKLIADFDCSSIEQTDVNDVICVKVPFVPEGEHMRGIQNVINTLRKNGIFPSEIGFDILTVATLVYLADTRISRQMHGQDSWSREIQLEVPVSDSVLWNEQISLLNRMLRFLTGDLWSVSFTPRTWMFAQEEQIAEKSSAYSRATLFSGGMDSLISTINLLETKNNALLIGHAGEGLTKNAQTSLLAKFNTNYPDLLHTFIDLWLNFPDNYIPGGGNDKNTRSRSFLFIGLGLFTITGTANIKELLVPENGLIALNVPLDETRVGSFSTRTTHPFYLGLWNELLVKLGLDLSVANPYWDKTKGEMANECLNKEFLFDTMKVSFSCSSPGKARWKGLSPQHCGYCVPCLIRRAAMYKAFGEDETVYTEQLISTLIENNTSGIGLQLRSFQYAIRKIKEYPGVEKMLIHKPGPLSGNEEFKERLADTYKRGLLEVDTFVNLMMEKEHNV